MYCAYHQLAESAENTYVNIKNMSTNNDTTDVNTFFIVS
jgi:hypothetical protein